MADDNATPNQPQEKKAFVIREVDTSLLDRLSPRAFRLWMILRKMGDAKTGEVRYGTHWYSPREIERKAEMSHNTRKAAMRELIAAGLAHRETPRHAVTVTERLSDKPRNHVVWAEARYFVSPTPRLDWLSSIDQSRKHNTGAGSSTAQNKGRRRKPRKQRASSIDQSKEQGNNPSIDQSVGRPPNGRQILQEAPIDLGASPLPFVVENNCPINIPSPAFQGSPPEAGSGDIYLYPPVGGSTKTKIQIHPDALLTLEGFQAAYAKLKEPMWTAREAGQRQLADSLNEQMDALDDATRCRHGFKRTFHCDYCIALITAQIAQK